MKAGNAGEGMSEGVHSSQTFLEGYGSHDRSHHHVRAGCEVVSILDRPRQMKDSPPRPLEGNRVAHGMITAGEVSFDVVRQGIKPCPGGDLRRHAKGQFRVRDRHAGDQVRTKENCLAIGGLEDDRSEEHTSELQSRLHLVCRLLLEKKKKRRRCTLEAHKRTHQGTHSTKADALRVEPIALTENIRSLSANIPRSRSVAWLPPERWNI